MLLMKVNFFLTYSFFIVFLANGDITFENDNETNRTCIIQNSGLQGVCLPFSKCKTAQMTFRNHKINPTICYFNDVEPVVCCSDIFENNLDHHNCRKSKIQCYKSPNSGGIFLVDCWEKACKEIVTDFKFGFDRCRLYAALNGVPTRIGDFPFMAAIGFRQFDGNILFNCGGFLVTRNFVITAAHCTNLGGDLPVVVRTGGIDLDNTTNVNLDIPISQIYMHPLYKSSQAYNDIALIKLSGQSKDDTKCLSDRDFLDYTGINVIVVGYGQISFGGPGSNKLLQVDLSVVNNEECKKMYPSNNFLPNGIQPSQICAIDLKKENTQDTCQGDSGGPLLTFLGGVPRLLGITSFGNICGSSTPGVYTFIEYYYDWIESIVWPNV